MIEKRENNDRFISGFDKISESQIEDNKGICNDYTARVEYKVVCNETNNESTGAFTLGARAFGSGNCHFGVDVAIGTDCKNGSLFTDKVVWNNKDIHIGVDSSSQTEEDKVGVAVIGDGTVTFCGNTYPLNRTITFPDRTIYLKDGRTKSILGENNTVFGKDIKYTPGEHSFDCRSDNKNEDKIEGVDQTSATENKSTGAVEFGLVFGKDKCYIGDDFDRNIDWTKVDWTKVNGSHPHPDDNPGCFPRFADNIIQTKPSITTQFQEVEPKFFDVNSEYFKPTRGTKYSAGYDFKAPFSFNIAPYETVKLKTNVRCLLPSDKYLKLVPRSSVGIKKNIMVANTCGIIDSDYYNNQETGGNIIIALYNYGEKTQSFAKGDAIVQGIIQPFYITDDDDVQTERVGGIGSTTK